MTNESRYMGRAIALAWRGQGHVEPNPMVGCVIVKNGRVVGEGYHRRFGGPHAERMALAAAGRRSRGATLYVTLEPCCHFGKTPPCVDAIIRAGVRRVVAAVRDPNPLVAGKGLARLRRAGIKVEVGLMKPEAEQLAAPFIVCQTLGRPYVILKWAQSIDGKIATRSGDSRWITSIESRRMAHALRARVDAIVVGVDTVLADDPELTARWVRPKRVATRVVLDSRFRTPLSSRLVRSARRVPTLVVGAKSPASAGRRRRLESAGCQVLPMPVDATGIDLARLLCVLREMGMTNVLVEGGGKALGGFVEARLADEAVVFVGPKLIGGETAPGPLRHRGPRLMRDLPAVEIARISHIGHDLCYDMRFSRSK
ncbi:MAG TPA: bifunctional diaminohydroxyphosphoribosylaminopyrimidine deaminase/5-amino-6-(5-phosphoribosylamino)uracil reductase RibD [Phycisphaerae bacterium]|nr:bifunctional diaminohydroxyphosphoribosylaminopyrimidine deaminase/5-amino-6-(5-phosphoribosylamino)uracil reductase RibD [Phycisphaerae bacterium]